MWIGSLGLHAAAIMAMSLYQFKQPNVDVPENTQPVDLQFIALDSQPLNPGALAELPPTADVPPQIDWVVEAIANCPQTPDDPPKDLPLEDVEALLRPESAKPTAVEPDVPGASMEFRFDSSEALKRALKLLRADAGGSRQSSGGAPVAQTSATGTVASDGEGNGKGTGGGSGSGSGNLPGKGNAPDGKGWRNGRGDGIGSGRAPGIADGGFKPPRVRHIATPVYPQEAQRAGLEGTVKVRVVILASGGIGSVEVLQSSGYDTLDRAACTAARKSSIEPLEEDGRPVTCDFTIPYRFSLNSR